MRRRADMSRGKKKPPVTTVPVTTLDTLRTQGYIPYYANVPSGVSPLPPGAGVIGAGDYPYVPTSESVQDYMPDVGGREDLAKPMPGWMTRASLLGTTSNAWKQMVLNVAAHSRFQIHFNDALGGPHNMDTEPGVTLDSRYAGRVLSDTSAASFPGTVDDAHHPQLAYLQYWAAVTSAEREICVRVMQWQAQWGMLRYGTSNGLGTFQKSAEQVRGEAHLLMNLGLAVVVTTHWETLGLTPTVPLRSANYLRRKMTNELLRLKQITVESSDPLVQYFRVYSFDLWRFWGTEQYALWMADMVTITLGWLARMGFAVAKEIFDWAVVGVQARHDTGLAWGRVYKVDWRPNLGVDPLVTTWVELYASAIIGSNFYSEMMHAVFCLDASMGGSSAARAAALRATGFDFWEIGYFFDPAVRAIPLVQATVSTDVQYLTYLVNEPADMTVVDGMGREYTTATPGKPIFLVNLAHDNPQAGIVHTGDDYAWGFYNGVNKFNGLFKIYFGDGWYWNMATKAFVAP